MVTAPIEMLKYSALSLVFGFVCTCILDIPMQFIAENKGKYTQILLITRDIISVLTYSILLVLVTYYFGNGVFRGIYLVSILFGIFIYYRIFASIFRKIIRIIIMPICYLLKKIIKTIRKIYVFFINTIEKIELKLYNNNTIYKS